MRRKNAPKRGRNRGPGRRQQSPKWRGPRHLGPRSQRDVDLGGAQRPGKAEVGLVKETLNMAPLTRPHGKGPVQLGAPEGKERTSHPGAKPR